MQFRFGGGAELLGADGKTVALDGGGSWDALSPLFRLRHRKIADIGVSALGTLDFDDGSSLVVNRDEQYESWS